MRTVQSIVIVILALTFAVASMTLNVNRDQPFCPTPTSCGAHA